MRKGSKLNEREEQPSRGAPAKRAYGIDLSELTDPEFVERLRQCAEDRHWPMGHVFELKRRGLHILDDDPHLRIAANEQIQSAKEAMQKISKEASGALVPGVSLYRRDSLLRSLAALGPHLDAFQKEVFLGLEAIRSQLGVFQEQFRASLVRVGEQMQDALVSYSEFVEGETILTMARNGWFPDLDLPVGQIKLWADDLVSDPERVHKANQELCNRFRERLDRIENRLRSEFPNRSEILGDAFQAHRQGKYNLSVVVFLTQVDGLFYDRYLKNLFYRKDWDDIAEIMGRMPDELDRLLSRALLYDGLPLVASRGQRQQQPDGFSELNRHQVLHGEATNYGTEKNSLKTISLLNYCAFVLPDVLLTEVG